jgi:hypothetical protein
MLVVMTISLLVIITGCKMFSSNKSTNEEYKYAVISSSMLKDKSKIALYDENGKFIKNKKIKYGGIALSGFKKAPEYLGDDVFIEDSAINFHSNDYTLKINRNTLKASEVPSTAPNSPTFFTIDDKYLYASSASPYETNLDKTDIKTNEIVKTGKVDVDAAVSINEKGDKLYLVSYGYESEKLKMYLSVLDKENLELEKKMSLGGGGGTESGKIVGNYLFVSRHIDEDNEYSKELIRINLNDYSTKIITLPFYYQHQLFSFKNYIYVTECDIHEETIENQVARVDIENCNVELFKTSNIMQASEIDKNKNEFLSTDGEKMYVYNLEDFNLKKSFELRQYYDLLFSSFFIK